MDEAEQGASGEKASSTRYYRIVFLCEVFQVSTVEEKDLPNPLAAYFSNGLRN